MTWVARHLLVVFLSVLQQVMNIPSFQQSQEAVLLKDIASLAALINSHKHNNLPPKLAPSFLASYPPSKPQKKYTNLSLSLTTHFPTKPKPKPPNLLATTPIPTPISTNISYPPKPKPYTSYTLKTPHYRLQVTKPKPSPNKQLKLQPSQPITRPSTPNTPTPTPKTPGLLQRRLSTKPTLIFNNFSVLSNYFRRGNTLVRKSSLKYIRPGVLIPDKKVGKQCTLDEYSL